LSRCVPPSARGTESLRTLDSNFTARTPGRSAIPGQLTWSGIVSRSQSHHHDTPGQILNTASSGEGPSPFRSLPNVMRARAFADERGLAMRGGRPTERRFTVGGSGKSVARCHRTVLAYWESANFRFLARFRPDRRPPAIRTGVQLARRPPTNSGNAASHHGLGFHRRRRASASGKLRTIPSQLVAPVAGSSGALWRVGDGFSRRAISPCGLNENAPVWLCLRQQRSSQPPTHSQARSPMAKRREGSQSQPASAERQGGVLAKNRSTFHSPSPRCDAFLRRKKLRSS
jgi:hypothetical protein